MIEQIQAAFPQIESCKTNLVKKHTFVIEDKESKKGVFVSDKQKFHLHVENRTTDILYFLQNDDCIMINQENGQCDYIIFNTFDFHLIDVKDSEIKSRKSNYRKKAYDQIENTFKHYSEYLTFSEKYNLFGLICFPSKSRIIKSSESIKKKEFKIKYNINLKEGNYILFD